MKKRNFIHLFYLAELKNEITKEHDWKEKLQQDFLRLQRVRGTKRFI
jgi:hypothetical protein